MNITSTSNFSQRPNGPSTATAEKRTVEELTRPKEQVKGETPKVELHQSVQQGTEKSPTSTVGDKAQSSEKAGDGQNQGKPSNELALSADNPEASLIKAQRVRAAALAPDSPSAQDRRVASQASRQAVEARADIDQLRRDDIKAEKAEKNAEEAEVEEKNNQVEAAPGAPQDPAKTSDNQAAKSGSGAVDGSTELKHRSLESAEERDGIIAANVRAEEYANTVAKPGGAGRIFNLVA